jgi:formylglycine-generating enzyme required for sulfatase activity
VTPDSAPAIRDALVAAVVTVLLLAVTTSTLVAPGPPRVIVEPRTGMQLVMVEPGSFEMGSAPGEQGRGDDETRHTVTLTKRFYMGRFEVTQTEWAVVMGGNPSRFHSCARCPVENVDFFKVGEFISNLNAQSTSMRYRLPTEAEWEYACRAGSDTAFSTGERLTRNDANFDARYPYPGEAPAEPAGTTRRVGSYPPNAWGLYDLHGNVWEWTNDWYGPYEAGPQSDPRGAAAGTRRVIRGGSFHFDANSARCALRYSHSPQDKGFSLGFRVVGEPISREHRNRDYDYDDDYRNR